MSDEGYEKFTTAIDAVTKRYLQLAVAMKAAAHAVKSFLDAKRIADEANAK